MTTAITSDMVYEAYLNAWTLLKTNKDEGEKAWKVYEKLERDFQAQRKEFYDLQAKHRRARS